MKPEGNDLKSTRLTVAEITPTEGLGLILTHSDSGAIIHLSGRLNIASSPLLRDRLSCLLRDKSVKTVIIDFVKVSYIDSSGVATLIEALKVARHRGAELKLKGLEGRLLHLFEVTGVLALFESDAVSTRSASEVS